MAVTAFWYGLTLQKIASGVGTGTPIIWTTDTIDVSLHTSTYTPNQDTDEFFDDATNEVAAGGGYTAGGETLASKTQDYTAGTNIVKLDAADVVWSASTITARYAVIRKNTGTAGTSPLLGYVDFGQDESSSSADFTITWSTDGILRVTAA